MAFVNLKKKEVQVKIVYYGPGRGGKTTNLEYIYTKFNERIQTEMVTVKTHGDRTLFFDFLPIDIGKINGYTAKMQLYTVPGQVKYNATRRLVLRGVDGIVFVADSMAVRREKNILSPGGKQFIYGCTFFANDYIQFLSLWIHVLMFYVVDYLFGCNIKNNRLKCINLLQFCRKSL